MGWFISPNLGVPIPIDEKCKKSKNKNKKHRWKENGYKSFKCTFCKKYHQV